MGTKLGAMISRETLQSEPPAARAERGLQELPHQELGAGRAPEVTGARMSAYTALGASVAAVPLPWLPAMLLRRIRGALVHDIAVRRGFSLTSDARSLLSNPSDSAIESGPLSQALR